MGGSDGLPGEVKRLEAENEALKEALFALRLQVCILVFGPHAALFV